MIDNNNDNNNVSFYLNLIFTVYIVQISYNICHIASTSRYRAEIWGFEVLSILCSPTLLHVGENDKIN